MATPMQIICCLLFYLILEIHASAAANLARQWTANVYAYNSRIVKVNNTLLGVGLENDTIFISPIEDSNNSSNTRSCQVALPSNLVVNDCIDIISLGNGKIVIIVNVLDTVSPYDKLSELYFIFDPFCSNIKNFQMPQAWKSLDRRFKILIPYHHTFDLFYRAQFTNDDSIILNTPHRYNDQGERIQLNYTFGLETELPVLFTIQTIKPYDASQGYVCTMLTANRTMSLKLLNSQFQVAKESTQDYWYIDTFSGDHGNVSICYVKKIPGKYEKPIYCKLLDRELKTKTTVHMIDPKSEFGYNVVIINLPDGGAVVGHAHRHAELSEKLNPENPNRPLESKPIGFYIQRINSDGSTRERVYVGERTGISDFTMQGFLLENGEFCLIVTVKSGYWTGKVFVDCIDVSN